jgi:tryptophan synthase alpha chain
MTYWNPVLRYGVDRFADDLAKAGGAGLITPDLIPDEGAQWMAAADRTGLDHVFLVAPSSTPQRLRSTTAACTGFVYAASSMGVTGAQATVGDAAQVLVNRTRQVTDTPICVGLGVSNGAQAAQVAAFADGVIVGSALVGALADAGSREDGIVAIRKLCAELAAGVRQGR